MQTATAHRSPRSAGRIFSADSSTSTKRSPRDEPEFPTPTVDVDPASGGDGNGCKRMLGDKHRDRTGERGIAPTPRRSVGIEDRRRQEERAAVDDLRGE